MVQSVSKAKAVDYSEYPRVFGLQMTDIHERVNMERMRRERLERARSLMKEAGISVMLLLLDENIRYTTGYAWLGYTTGGAYVLLPLEGDPILFAHVQAAYHEKQPGMMTWIKPENIRTAFGDIANAKVAFGNDRQWGYIANLFAQQIKDALEEMGLAKEVLTVDVNYSDIIEVFKSKGIRVTVNGNVLEEARTIKTKDEIECMRACSAICDLVHYELSKYADAGKTERELSGYMDFIAMKYGAEPTPKCYVNSGHHTHNLYIYPTDKMLMVGDLMVADTIQISWNGYKSCSYRTYSIVTPPSQAAIDTYKQQVDEIYDCLSRVKPGNTTYDVYPSESGCGRIHGLGIRNYGPPWGDGQYSRYGPYELREGMVFAIAQHTATPDGQGVAFEEHVVVTKTGYEVLTHAPKEIRICPAR
mgnify:CR=1 FL=1